MKETYTFKKAYLNLHKRASYTTLVISKFRGSRCVGKSTPTALNIASASRYADEYRSCKKPVPIQIVSSTRGVIATNLVNPGKWASEQ
jgi:hypothetical protein